MIWHHQEEKQIEKKREEVVEAETTNMKAVIERDNQRVLLYGNEILEESRGVRPLYPIIKAVKVGPSTHRVGI